MAETGEVSVVDAVHQRDVGAVQQTISRFPVRSFFARRKSGLINVLVVLGITLASFLIPGSDPSQDYWSVVLTIITGLGGLIAVVSTFLAENAAERSQLALSILRFHRAVLTYLYLLVFFMLVAVIASIRGLTTKDDWILFGTVTSSQISFLSIALSVVFGVQIFRQYLRITVNLPHHVLEVINRWQQQFRSSGQIFEIPREGDTEKLLFQILTVLRLDIQKDRIEFIEPWFNSLAALGEVFIEENVLSRNINHLRVNDEIQHLYRLNSHHKTVGTQALRTLSRIALTHINDTKTNDTPLDQKREELLSAVKADALRELVNSCRVCAELDDIPRLQIEVFLDTLSLLAVTGNNPTQTQIYEMMPHARQLYSELCVIYSALDQHNPLRTLFVEEATRFSCSFPKIGSLNPWIHDFDKNLSLLSDQYSSELAESLLLNVLTVTSESSPHSSRLTTVLSKEFLANGDQFMRVARALTGVFVQMSDSSPNNFSQIMNRMVEKRSELYDLIRKNATDFRTLPLFALLAGISSGFQAQRDKISTVDSSSGVKGEFDNKENNFPFEMSNHLKLRTAIDGFDIELIHSDDRQKVVDWCHSTLNTAVERLFNLPEPLTDDFREYRDRAVALSLLLCLVCYQKTNYQSSFLKIAARCARYLSDIQKPLDATQPSIYKDALDAISDLFLRELESQDIEKSSLSIAEAKELQGVEDVSPLESLHFRRGDFIAVFDLADYASTYVSDHEVNDIGILVLESSAAIRTFADKDSIDRASALKKLVEKKFLKPNLAAKLALLLAESTLHRKSVDDTELKNAHSYLVHLLSLLRTVKRLEDLNEDEILGGEREKIMSLLSDSVKNFDVHGVFRRAVARVFPDDTIDSFIFDGPPEWIRTCVSVGLFSDEALERLRSEDSENESRFSTQNLTSWLLDSPSIDYNLGVFLLNELSEQLSEKNIDQVTTGNHEIAVTKELYTNLLLRILHQAENTDSVGLLTRFWTEKKSKKIGQQFVGNPVDFVIYLDKIKFIQRLNLDYFEPLMREQFFIHPLFNQAISIVEMRRQREKDRKQMHRRGSGYKSRN